MKEENTNIKMNITGSTNSIPYVDPGDFANYLSSYNLPYIVSGDYYQVGELSMNQGFIFHISVIPTRFIDLMDKLVPFLQLNQIPFKIVRNTDISFEITNGSRGIEKVGKIICIYPTSEMNVEELGYLLVQEYGKFPGMEVPTDVWIGGCIYVGYGAHQPKIIVGPDGISAEYILNDKNIFIKDRPPVPFKLPSWAHWPFRHIKPESNKPKNLLNKKYVAYERLKSDLKGDVVKGISFKNILNPHWCLIKQGKKWAFCDAQSRDIRDRLKWQYAVLKHLKSTVNVPQVYDFFYDQENAYLVTEFIEGIMLDRFLKQQYEKGCWGTFDSESKIKILGYLIQIAKILKEMHDLGYIHHDCTPANFMIRNDDQIFIIDPELVYSIPQNSPNPPFTLGTPGYMSLEQQERLRPTPWHDIYAFGALLLKAFSGHEPYRFDIESSVSLTKSLNFYIDAKNITQLIVRAISKEESDRPTIEEMISTLSAYKDHLTNSKVNIEYCPPDMSMIRKGFLENTIEALCCMRNEQEIWFTIRNEEFSAGIDSTEIEIQPGLWEGVSGPLYIFALAKQIGLSIDHLTPIYQLNFEYLIDNYYKNPAFRLGPGLATGKAGIAVAISEGIRSGLIPKDSKTHTVLEWCFDSNNYESGNLSEGAAGIGLALLKCADSLNIPFIDNKLEKITDYIINGLNSNGSWKSPQVFSTKESGINISLGTGSTGLIYFLLCIYQKSGDKKLLHYIDKSLTWFINKRKNIKNQKGWAPTTKGKEIKRGIDRGMPGYAAVLIEAYKVLGQRQLKSLAEESLDSLSEYQLYKSLTIKHGIGGLGQVYLDAYKYLGTPKYKQQANWIEGMFMSTTNCRDGYNYWLDKNARTPSPSLFLGNAGIIHFLLRLHDESINNLILY